jgi:hypothetical protein
MHVAVQTVGSKIEPAVTITDSAGEPAQVRASLNEDDVKIAGACQLRTAGKSGESAANYCNSFLHDLLRDEVRLSRDGPSRTFPPSAVPEHRRACIKIAGMCLISVSLRERFV